MISPNVNSIIYSNCQAGQTFIIRFSRADPCVLPLKGRNMARGFEGSSASACSREGVLGSRFRWAAQSEWTVHTAGQAVAALDWSSPSSLRTGPAGSPVPCALGTWSFVVPRCKVNRGMD